MDIKVENKDLVLKDNGLPVMIEGLELAVQQLRFASSVEKGTFVYDRELGLCIPEDIYEKENCLKTIETMLNEILIHIPGVTVFVKSINRDQEKTTVQVVLKNDYNSIETEVTINENL